jgi:hypothetical protein
MPSGALRKRARRCSGRVPRTPLAVARQHLGSLDKVTRIVRLGVLVATSGDVREQPRIADGASELLQDVFGKDKNPGRLVYGVASLPLGVSVELELIFEVSAKCRPAGMEPAHSETRDRLSRHSRCAQRIVITKIDGSGLQLWRTGIVCCWHPLGLALGLSSLP